MTTKRWNKKVVLTFCCAVMLMLFIGILKAEATIEQMKLYKTVFSGSKPKCSSCHVDKVPKKDEGMHDLNAYGLKVMETDEEPTEETYKTIGTMEDFEEKSEGADVEEDLEEKNEGADAEEEKKIEKEEMEK